MTAESREALRQEIDQARRAAIDWNAEERCKGCGVECSDAWTREPRYVDGCHTCAERRHGRRRRSTSAQLTIEGVAA